MLLKKFNWKKYKAIFITGTDTEVGKTFVTAELAKELRHQGLSVGIMKPVSCGLNNDATYLKKRLNLDDPQELLNPYNFPLPLCPYANELEEKKKISFKKEKIKTALKKLKKKYDVVLVEGVGGILVPIKKNYAVENLIKYLNLPVIVVSRAGLGTLNHTLLTIQRLKSKKAKILGIILNGFRGNLSERTNPKILEELGKVPVISKIPWQV